MRKHLGLNQFFAIALTACLCAVSLASCASDDAPTGSGVGVVKQVDREHKMITLDHGRIPKIMGAMVMAYRVEEPKLLDIAMPGDSVSFTLQESTPGDYQIASITKIQNVAAKTSTAPPTAKPSSSATSKQDGTETKESKK